MSWISTQTIFATFLVIHLLLSEISLIISIIIEKAWINKYIEGAEETTNTTIGYSEHIIIICQKHNHDKTNNVDFLNELQIHFHVRESVEYNSLLDYGRHLFTR